MSQIVLVGGTGRCGTTIVNWILGEHRNTVVTPPWRFMIDPDGMLEFWVAAEQCWSPYHMDIRYKRLRRLLRDVSRPRLPMFMLDRLGLRRMSRRIPFNILPRYVHLDASGFCPGFDDIAERFLGQMAEFSFTGNWVGTKFMESPRMNYAGPAVSSPVRQVCARFLEEIVEATCQAHDATVFVDRNTWNFLWLDRFLSISPSIKLLHVYRDPRDVIASFMAQPWMPSDAAQAAQVYRDLMEAWWLVRERVPTAAYHEFSLEELVDQPEETLNRICEFVGIPWDEDMLRVRLDGANSGRWRRDLSQSDQKAVKIALGPVLDNLGYA